MLAARSRSRRHVDGLSVFAAAERRARRVRSDRGSLEQPSCGKSRKRKFNKAIVRLCQLLGGGTLKILLSAAVFID